MTLAKQLEQLRAIKVRPGDWRASKRKREACTRLEVMRRSKWKPEPGYRDPF